MNAPAGWPLLLAAAAATAFAIDAEGDLAVGLPAGVLAVALAAAFLIISFGGVHARRPPAPRLAAPVSTTLIRSAFHSGRSGRLAIVTTVDQLERRVHRPGLPMRPPVQDEEIRRMSPAEFRAYLNRRLDVIERGGL